MAVSFTIPKAALAYLAVKVGMVYDNPYILHYLQQIPVLVWDLSVGDLGTALTTMALLEQQIRYSLDFWLLFIKKNYEVISVGN